jgi:hypothetical protein
MHASPVIIRPFRNGRDALLSTEEGLLRHGVYSPANAKHAD